MSRIGLIAVIVAASVAIAGGAGAGAAVEAATTLDIEFAVDSTGSMAPTIAQAKVDAEQIMEAVRAIDPGARFAVVAFRDPGYPAPEYEILQRFTADVNGAKRALGRLKAVTYAGPENVPSEAYNLVFQRSVTDGSLGWRANSRKVVVVLGDGEPHGAGGLGIRGCRDNNPDTHGLKSTDVLQQMRNAGRTLVMVRQRGDADVALDCYSQLSALAAPGGAARDSGSADLASPIVSLVEGALTPFVLNVGAPFALTGSALTVSLRVSNATGVTASLDAVSARLPAGTSFVSASGPLGSPKVTGRLLEWLQPRNLPAGTSVTGAVRVATGARPARLSFVGSAKLTRAESRMVTVNASAAVRVGRALGVRVVATAPPPTARGAFTLEYPVSARKLIGRTAARGSLTLRAGTRSLTIRLASARILTAGADASMVVVGTVARSSLASCRAGTAVTLRLVDHDFLRPRTVPDLVLLRGKGCDRRYSGEASVA